jgi:hypothetical protein
MMVFLSLLTLLTSLLAPGQRERPSVNDELTLDSARPVIDNQRATVWDLSWTKGVPASMERTSTNALWISVAPTPGTVIFWAKGAERRGTPSPGAPAHMVVVDIKDAPPGTMQNKSGFPNAFPRPRNKKVFENDRVVVWDYTWVTGQPTAMHFHDKDALVVYLKNGLVKSTTPDGMSIVNKMSVGKIVFNARDRVHSETLTEGESRAIITEFK